MCLTKKLQVPTDFHIMGKKYYGSQWEPEIVWLLALFIISSFIFNGKKKLQVWNKLRMSKWWQNFHFGVNYPFKMKIDII